MDGYVDSSRKGMLPTMPPTHVGGGRGLTQFSSGSGIGGGLTQFSSGSGIGGGLIQFSSGSGIFFRGDGQSPGSSNLGPGHGDMNNATMNTVVRSGPSVGASSLVTDANSSLSGGPQLQRSTSINTESHMRLPTSPISFSSNNMSICGSSVVDGSSIVQQPNLQDPGGASSSATSLPTPQHGRVDPRGDGLFYTDRMKKRPRLDIKHEDILQQQLLQQMLQGQQPMQLHNNRNPQLQTFLNLQRLKQQLPQSMPLLQRAHVQQQSQQQQMQLWQQMHQQQPVSVMSRPSDGGVCARRLMQYLYHQRQRPAENAVAYWRKFVAEYYSPRAKERWCLSQYNNIGRQALGVFPQAAMEAWQCDICGSKCGRGFEATFEVLPRLNEIKFGSGIIDELLFLDFPHECRFPSGIMMLEYRKAVQESVYEQLRVVREGQLRIMFTNDLKILSWEFCARRHEELLPRRVVAPQVNQMLQVAQKCQNTITESGPNGVSQEDLQSNSNMVTVAGRQLGKVLELPSLNDLGFSKRYVRCLQISEVVNSMKDLIGLCRENKVGPIEGLKSYAQHVTASKRQVEKMQEKEQLGNAIKLAPLYSGTNNATSSNSLIDGRGALSGSAQAASAVTNYNRQTSMNSNSNLLLQQEAALQSKYFNASPSSTIHRTMQSLPGSAVSSHHMPARSMSSTSLVIQQTQTEPSHNKEVIQQQMNQQALLAGRGGHGMNLASNTSMSDGDIMPTSSRTDSVKASTSNNDNNSSVGGNSAVSIQNEPCLAPDFQLDDDLIQDIAREFTTGGFFDDFLDDDLISSSWKA